MIDNAELIARLAVAMGCGLALGIEREVRSKVAGLRTHGLVAVGAALFTIAGAYGVDTVALDPSRVAAQVVTGIGFIGAGAIMRSGFSISGITTASTLWLAAALGVAAGFGMYLMAVVALAMGLVLVALVGPLTSLLPWDRSHRLELTYHSGEGTLAPLFAALSSGGLVVREMKLDESDTGVRDVRLILMGGAADVAEVVAEIALRPEVISIGSNAYKPGTP